MLGALNDYVCGSGEALDSWILHPKVKEALHVDANASYFSGDNGAGFTYNSTEKSV